VSRHRAGHVEPSRMTLCGTRDPSPTGHHRSSPTHRHRGIFGDLRVADSFRMTGHDTRATAPTPPFERRHGTASRGRRLIASRCRYRTRRRAGGDAGARRCGRSGSTVADRCGGALPERCADGVTFPGRPSYVRYRSTASSSTLIPSPGPCGTASDPPAGSKGVSRRSERRGFGLRSNSSIIGSGTCRVWG